MALFKAAGAVLLALSAVVLLAAAPAAAGAEFPQVRLTHFGPDGDLTQQAGFPAVAFNSQANQYLLVYQAGPTGDTDHWPIYGQLIDAAGNPVGGQITVSLPTANRICNYEPPNVAYSERLNEFLVTWNEGTAATCDDSIYAQRIGADGSLLAVPSQADQRGRLHRHRDGGRRLQPGDQRVARGLEELTARRVRQPGAVRPAPRRRGNPGRT